MRWLSFDPGDLKPCLLKKMNVQFSLIIEIAKNILRNKHSLNILIQDVDQDQTYKLSFAFGSHYKYNLGH